MGLIIFTETLVFRGHYSGFNLALSNVCLSRASVCSNTVLNAQAVRRTPVPSVSKGARTQCDYFIGMGLSTHAWTL